MTGTRTGKKASSPHKYTTISVPKVLVGKVKERLEGTGFNSVSSFTTYLLRQVVSYDKEEPSKALSKEEEERLKRRLKSLGYFD
jgi:hypothetical protein